MKILNIDDLGIGEYNPACEGFVDMLKSIFGKKKKGQFDDNLAAVKGTQGYSVLVHKLEEDLKSTYDNHEWVTTNLGDTSGMITEKKRGMGYANIDGKPVTDPASLLKAAQSMLAIVKDTVHREMPFIERRKKLIAEINAKKDPAFADKIWEDNAKALTPTAADRFAQKHKGHIPALANSPEKDGEWPISAKKRWNYCFTNSFPSHETDGTFEAPSAKNAKAFADTIRGLVKMLLELNEIVKATKIPYWEFLEVEYDDLKHGDVIYDRIATADGWHEVDDLADGLGEICYILSLGLYIIMFDKHGPEKK